MNLKNITEVALKSTPELTENVIVEDNGEAKRVPMSAIKTGGGAGFDVIITAKANLVEESGSGSYAIPFELDMETVNVETSLTFDELIEKWYSFTMLMAVDASESGYTLGEMRTPLFWRVSNLMADEMEFSPIINMDAEMATMLTQVGLTAAEGDSGVLFVPALNGKYPDAPESGGDSEDEAGIYTYLWLCAGSNGEVVLEQAQT